MKIAMISKFPPDIGGIEKHAYELSKKLVKHGHEVFVITFTQKETILHIKGIHVIETKMLNIPYLKGLTFVISAKKILENLVKKENIDIIHGQSVLGPGFVAVEIGEKYNIPTYVTSHGNTPDKFKNPLIKRMIQRTLNKADHILAVSNKIVDKLSILPIKNIEKKISLHTNAVNLNKFKEIPQTTKKEMPIVIFVGRLEKEKNLITLLDAKKHSKTNYKLLIVGEGSQHNKLRKKVKNNKIKNVEFMGARKDIEKILPHADLFVLPSFTEGLSIALIEALACGLPVIGSNIDGMNELITPHTGLLIDPYDYKSISNAIDEILTNKKLYNKFKSNARQKAMEFSEIKIPYQELK